jgi:hypothetical protein
MTAYPKYPIYSFSASWTEDGVHNPEQVYRHRGLPDGRIWNSCFLSNRMFKEKQDERELAAWLIIWWKNYLETELIKKSKNVELYALHTAFVEEETWCSTWFEHFTFDVGQSDTEALASFENYVCRNADNLGKLMGAEDRWRWHGAEPDGKPDTHSTPPCRCQGCKKQGIIKIGH